RGERDDRGAAQLPLLERRARAGEHPDRTPKQLLGGGRTTHRVGRAGLRDEVGGRGVGGHGCPRRRGGDGTTLGRRSWPRRGATRGVRAGCARRDGAAQTSIDGVMTGFASASSLRNTNCTSPRGTLGNAKRPSSST